MFYPFIFARVELYTYKFLRQLHINEALYIVASHSERRQELMISDLFVIGMGYRKCSKSFRRKMAATGSSQS
jgi:hypothetical protein